MHRFSAESAFSSIPSITCAWSWGDMNQTCTPTANLTSNTLYKITISTNAKDLSDNSMRSPYTFSFTTAPPPSPPSPVVVGTMPKNGAKDVPIPTEIVIFFDQDMDLKSTESSLSGSPLISGIFTWKLGPKTMKLTVYPDLLGNTTYTITVSTAAKSELGVNMSSPYSFSFTTEPVYQTLKVLTTFPCDKGTDVGLDTKIYVLFSERMDRPLTESAVISKPAVNWSANWTQDDSMLTLTPSSPLESDTLYSITVGMGARSVNYAHLVAPYTFTFTTGNASDIVHPTVVSTSPYDNATDVDPASKITITFSEPMNRSATESALSITPGSMVKTEWDANGKTLTITVSLEERTRYTVTVSTGAKDLAGNAMVDNHIFSFTTKSTNVSNTAISLSVLFILIFLGVLFLMKRRERKIASKGLAPKEKPSPRSTSERGSKNENDRTKTSSSGPPSSGRQVK